MALVGACNLMELGEKIYPPVIIHEGAWHSIQRSKLAYWQNNCSFNNMETGFLIEKSTG